MALGSGIAALGLVLSPAAAGVMHKGNANTPEARSCAQFVEQRYNRVRRDTDDWRADTERFVEITFFSVAQVPQLFGGNKYVSMAVREHFYQGDQIVETRPVRTASYCVLDPLDRVIGLEREMR